MKHIEEDFEMLSKLDQMYLIEAHERMIEEWCEREDYQNRRPAQIKLKIKKHGLEKAKRKVF